MIEAEVDARERTIEVPPAALGKILPGLGPYAESGRRSRLARLVSAFRVWSRLMTMRLLYRMGNLRSLRCRVVQCRLRAKLLWLKLRHRRLLTDHSRRRKADPPPPTECPSPE